MAFKKLSENPKSVVLHIGCGLDSRIKRVAGDYKIRYDIDLPEVISVRREYYDKDERYKMFCASAMESGVDFGT